jgi:hypothetical protein
MEINETVKRLYEEWRTHGKIILAVDFDDTVSPWRLRSQEQCDETIAQVKNAQDVGAYVMIFTACDPDRYAYIHEYMAGKGVKVDTINEPPIKGLRYGNFVKPYYNHLLDDRAGLGQAVADLEAAMVMMRSYKHGQTMDYPGASGF